MYLWGLNPFIIFFFSIYYIGDIVIPSISVSEFLKLQNPAVIDIRDAQNYNNNHIPNARNIKLESLIARPSEFLNKEDTYYVYCTYGKKSFHVCQILNSLGYKTISIHGGYESWILER